MDTIIANTFLLFEKKPPLIISFRMLVFTFVFTFSLNTSTLQIFRLTYFLLFIILWLFDCFAWNNSCLSYSLFRNASQLILRGNWNNHLCFFSGKDTPNILLMPSDQFTLKQKEIRIRWIRCSYQYSFFFWIKIFGIWYFHEQDFIQWKTPKQNK